MLLRVFPRLSGFLLFIIAVAISKGANDKSSYSFLRPTPPELLRELTTDRPDVTESPFTVDAGHTQIEADFAAFGRNHLDGTRTTDLSVATFNVRVGLLPNLEAGVFISPYIRNRETPRSRATETHSGFGDVTLRGKINFLGNDAGDAAYGLIVDLKLPTASRALGNGAVEGRIILPVNFKLPSGWELSAMTESDFVQGEDGSGRNFAWGNSISVSHGITDKLGGYMEFTSLVGPGTPALTADFGLTWSVDKNTQLDGGVNIGLTRAADDAVFFAGVSRRF